ncbi:MAG: hypothetical protein JNM94_01430 [Phycisphaerae bacterium]|nr:hypothetical protein [Phycisphaerae bacterium]
MQLDESAWEEITSLATVSDPLAAKTMDGYGVPEEDLREITISNDAGVRVEFRSWQHDHHPWFDKTWSRIWELALSPKDQQPETTLPYDPQWTPEGF